MVACRYGIFLLGFINVSHSFAELTCEISSWTTRRDIPYLREFMYYPLCIYVLGRGLSNFCSRSKTNSPVFFTTAFDMSPWLGRSGNHSPHGLRLEIKLPCLYFTAICFLAYFGVSTVLTLMWPYKTLPEDGPLPSVFAMRGAPWAKYIIAVGALCALTSSLLGALVPLPRMLYSMASDGIIFK